MPREKDPFRDYVEYLENSNNNNNNIKWKCNFCNNEYRGSVTRIKAHLAGLTGFGINQCKAVNHRVRSEAKKALKGKGVKESTNGSEGNAEEVLYEPVIANNEDGWRDASFTVPETEGSLWMQHAYTYPGDSYPPQLNFNHTSTSQDVAPEALTNRPRPVNAEARGPYPEVPQGMCISRSTEC